MHTCTHRYYILTIRTQSARYGRYPQVPNADLRRPIAHLVSQLATPCRASLDTRCSAAICTIRIVAVRLAGLYAAGAHQIEIVRPAVSTRPCPASFGRTAWIDAARVLRPHQSVCMRIQLPICATPSPAICNTGKKPLNDVPGRGPQVEWVSNVASHRRRH